MKIIIVALTMIFCYGVHAAEWPTQQKQQVGTDSKDMVSMESDKVLLPLSTSVSSASTRNEVAVPIPIEGPSVSISASSSGPSNSNESESQKRTYSEQKPPQSNPENSSLMSVLGISEPMWALYLQIFILLLGSISLILWLFNNKKKSNQLVGQSQSKTRRYSKMPIKPLNASVSIIAKTKPTGWRSASDAIALAKLPATIAVPTASMSLVSDVIAAKIPSTVSVDTLLTPDLSLTEPESVITTAEINTDMTSLKNDDASMETMREPISSEPTSPVERQKGTTHSKTLLSDTWQLFGTSKQGQTHLSKTPTIPCQDSHFIQKIDDDWGIVVVCDGAGSQLHSQYGAQFVAEEIATHLVTDIPKTNIYKTEQLPNDEAWRQYCKALVWQTRTKLEEWVIDKAQMAVEMEGATIRDVGCTLIWLVYTPNGLLAGHVGDGRAGYRDADGWHSMMTPWEGEYTNQTVFINTDSIYQNQLENPEDPTRSYLESRVIRSTNIDAFVLMTDGCESGLYETVTYDPNTNANVKINKPHAGICDNIIRILDQKLNDPSVAEYKLDEVENLFSDIVEEGNSALKNEGDDKTLVIGFLSKPTPFLEDVEP